MLKNLRLVLRFFKEPMFFEKAEVGVEVRSNAKVWPGFSLQAY